MKTSELIKKAIISVINDEVEYNTDSERVDVLEYLFDSLQTAKWSENNSKITNQSDNANVVLLNQKES